MAEAYPLHWPQGWPRTPENQRADGRRAFGRFEQRSGESWRSKRALTLREARETLYAALRRIGATGAVVSTNFQLNMAGEPRGDRGRPADQAVAVYFRRRGRDLVMARDAYERVEENMRSLALALEAMASLERHGGDMITDRAYTGFAALPPPPSCWEILGLDPKGATAADVQDAFRRRSRTTHPDAPGGDEAAFKALTEARSNALAALGGAR